MSKHYIDTDTLQSNLRDMAKYAEDRSTDGLKFEAAMTQYGDGFELRVNGNLYDAYEVDPDVVISDILSLRNGFDWGKEAAKKADEKSVYAFVVSNLNPSEFAPNVSLTPTADYDMAVKMLKEQFLFDLDLEANEGNGVVNMSESGWHDDENYGDIVFCDDSRTRYEVVSLSDWSRGDLDRAEKMER
jgi:hypothetical protein